MGTQQTLIIAFGILIIGITLGVAVNAAGRSSDCALKDAITQDCLRLASEARGYYLKPRMFGGGGGSYDGISLSALGYSRDEEPNGDFTVRCESEICTIIGVPYGCPDAAVVVAVSAGGESTTTYRGW